MKLYLKLLMTMFMALSNHGHAKAPLHSKVEVKHDASKGSLEFVIVPDQGLIINEEGPWKVEVVDVKGADMKAKVALKNEFDLKAGKATLAATKTTKEKASIKFKFVGFVCTKDKSKCFRDVHEGAFSF